MPGWLLTPRWLGITVSLVLVVLLCVTLGWWQWNRATASVVRTPPAGVEPLTSLHGEGRPVDPDDAGRRVLLRGTFDPAREVLVVDRLDGGVSGSWVVTAFELDSPAGAIPVVRGWIADGDDPPAPPTGTTTIVGWLEPSEPTTLRDPDRPPLPPGSVELVSSAELLSLWKPPLLQGFVVLQRPEPSAPLRPVSPPALGSTTEVDWQNLAYAIQWWLFGLFAVFWFVRMVRVEREDRAASDQDDATPGGPGAATVGTIEASDQGGAR